MTIKKTDFIWFNGKIISWNAATIHVMSHVLHYGSSVFEGMRCYNSYKGSVIFRHREHMERLINSARIYRMPISWDIHELMEACRLLIRKNKLVDNLYIRPIVFIGDTGIEISPSCDYVADVAIAVFSWPQYLIGERVFEVGIDVSVSSWNRMSLNTIPSVAKAGGNYLSSMLIMNEARRHGCQEGIALDVHGHVSEASGENIFVVKDNILFTPPCSLPILPGITRDSVIKLAQSNNIEVQEILFSRELLYLADEIFLSGTASEIVPVRSVDGVSIGLCKVGPVTKKIQNLFFGLFTGKVHDQWNWLDAVDG